jgi:alanine racemase
MHVPYPGPDRRKADRRQPRIVEVRPTWAAIDAAALGHNLRTVQAHVGARCRVLAVVKADGYGHGAIDSARAFVDAGA